MNNIIDTVENRIQNAILIAIENIVAPKIDLAIRSKNAPSGQAATSVSVNSERREHVGINAFFENASGNNNTQGVSNGNDETRHNNPDEVSELPVPETHFDRQTHTHHSKEFHFCSFLIKKHLCSKVEIGAVTNRQKPTDTFHPLSFSPSFEKFGSRNLRLLRHWEEIQALLNFEPSSLSFLTLITRTFESRKSRQLLRAQAISGCS